MTKPESEPKAVALTTDDPLLAALASRAADEARDGMIIGLGSGSTSEAVVRELGDRVKRGLSVTGVPTSQRTARLAQAVKIPMLSLDAVAAAGRPINLGLDGADEIAPNLDATKGRGGALLYEKLVALLCERFVLVSSAAKCVDQLGIRLPLPVEVVPLGWESTRTRLMALGLKPVARRVTGPGDTSITDELALFVTDGGHVILDCATGPVDDPAALADAIKRTTGVVDHGYFLGIADEALVADSDGTIRSLGRVGR